MDHSEASSEEWKSTSDIKALHYFFKMFLTTTVMDWIKSWHKETRDGFIPPIYQANVLSIVLVLVVFEHPDCFNRRQLRSIGNCTCIYNIVSQIILTWFQRFRKQCFTSEKKEAKTKESKKSKHWSCSRLRNRSKQRLFKNISTDDTLKESETDRSQ